MRRTLLNTLNGSVDIQQDHLFYDHPVFLFRTNPNPTLYTAKHVQRKYFLLPNAGLEVNPKIKSSTMCSGKMMEVSEL